MFKERKIALALAILVIISSVALLSSPAAASWLERNTGERETYQQLKGLLLSLPRRQLDTADLVPVSNASYSPYGANTFFEQEVEEGKIRRSMEMLRDAGVRWIRQQTPWIIIERDGKGKFGDPPGSSWKHYDLIVALANEYGLKVVARLDLPPLWARIDSKASDARPRKIEDYGDFVYAFVKRYKGQVGYVQIWNEPNLYDEWGEPPDAGAYTELLKEGYRKAKEANPDVVVLSAALAPTLGTPDGNNESDLTYLQKMYDAGAASYFDILSAQAYGLWTGPGNRRVSPEQVNFSRVQLIRDIMVKNGDANKSIWVSELGWSALPIDFPATAVHGRVDEERQARYTATAYERIQEEWPWIGVAFYWHFRRVSDESRGDLNFYFRMVDPDFTPRPVYYAYKDVANAPAVLHYGRRQEDNWALRYSGGLLAETDSNAELGRKMVGSASGDSLSFTFKGSSLSLLTEKGPGAGTFCVEIDGVRQDPCVSLKSNEKQNTEVSLATGLEVREHSVKLQVRGDGEVSVDALVVDSRRDSIGQGVFGLGLLLVSIFMGWLVIKQSVGQGSR
ncbi:MAG: hypothetical protein EXR50_00655 [Dehalococcoidia bacterium]|nr:hypothetical protein [Dehalococcoidia bacterium]